MGNTKQKNQMYPSYEELHQQHQRFLLKPLKQKRSEGYFSNIPKDVMLLLFEWIPFTDLLRIVPLISKTFYFLMQESKIWTFLLKTEIDYDCADISQYSPQCMKCIFRDNYGLKLKWNPLKMNNPDQLSFCNDYRTVMSNQGGWNTVMLGEDPIRVGKHQFYFFIDNMPVNGMMIGLISEAYQHKIKEIGYYPGGGYPTVTSMPEVSIAWYSV